MTKRSSEQFKEMSDGELEMELENLPMENCDAVRRKIRALIDNNEMKVGEFQRAINVTATAYGNFMTQHGAHKGGQSSVYPAAWGFFKKRELKGIKTVANKKAKTAKATEKEGEDGNRGEGAKGSKAKGKKTDELDVSGVELEGEKDDNVPIYDTCDDIRRKINLHLKKPSVTQAAFLRAISASFRTIPKKIQSTSLNRFRGQKGAYEGNTSAVFYGTYVFFEKLRIKEGKKKSDKRLEMEKIWALEGGMDTSHRHDSFICVGNARPHIDKMGKVHMLRGH